MTNAAATPPRPKRRRALTIYLALLLLSHVAQLVMPESWFRLRTLEPRHADVQAPTSDATSQRVRLGYVEWLPGAPSARPPVILLHGSPGQAPDFARMGPLIAQAGYRAIAVDMPGFNESSAIVRDYSILANAHAMLALLDSLAIDRAHVVGWSNGGGVALHMADLAPHRVASLTLLASIGAQEHEGSGDFHFEHFKYAMAFVFAVAAPEVVPHFGLLGPRQMRYAFARNFWDSDQRPLRAIMQRLSTPTLIIHGRRDVLIPDWAAEDHHRLITSSSLVMLPWNHFLPFTHPGETTDHILPFLARHDAPGVAPLTTSLDLAPAAPRTGLTGAAAGFVSAVREAPWWSEAALIALLVLAFPVAGTLAGAMLVTHSGVDLAVGMTGVMLGLLGRSALLSGLAAALRDRIYHIPWLGRRLPHASAIDWRNRLEQRPITEGWRSGVILSSSAWAAVGAGLTGRSLVRFMIARCAGLFAWSVVTMIVATILIPLIVSPADRALPWAGGLLVHVMLARFIASPAMLLSRRGRQMLRARAARIIHYEYWPAIAFYLPLIPYLLTLAIRHRGLLPFTCCNPAIENGGGFIGESKTAIVRALLASRHTLAAELIPATGTPDDRADAALRALRERPELGGFPVILKPDAGQRGFGLKLARSEDDVRAYFRVVRSPAMVQRYHPGPEECGVMWARRPGTDDGFIYSIARKDFPVITGDGVSTLEDLIYAHRRFRRQAHVFLARFADRASSVPREGERIRLAESGNHCQGTLFRDGADLITPQLTREMNRIARGFAEGRGLDFGRFDLRYESDEKLRAGEGFGIVELNGTTGESTNLYDPGKNLLWAYRVLFGQWALLFALGAERRDAGATPLTWRGLLALSRAHYRERTGPELAD